MREPVTVACAQVGPVLFDREATIGRLEEVAAEARGKGAQLVLFPETFIPAYPTNRWVRYLAGGDGEAKHVFARLARESLEVPSAASERIGNAAREHGLWLAVGADARDGGTIYNALLLYGPDGELALHHRKLVPTNHERMVWGPGDGGGLRAVETDLGRVRELSCSERFV